MFLVKGEGWSISLFWINDTVTQHPLAAMIPKNRVDVAFMNGQHRYMPPGVPY